MPRVKEKAAELLIHGRQRRSAAAASTKAWATLIPKKSYMEEPVTDDCLYPSKQGKPHGIKCEVVDGQENEFYRSEKNAVSLCNSNGTSSAAIGKEEIDNIEKEMIRTYMSNEDDDEDYDFEEDSMKVMDDADDEDFIEPSALKFKHRELPLSRPVRGRGRPPNSSYAVKAKNIQPVRSVSQFITRPVISRDNYVPASTSYATSKKFTTALPVSENRPLKIILRPPKQRAEIIPGMIKDPLNVSSMSVTTNGDNFIGKKLGDRVIAGDKVSKFNNLIDILLDELKFLSEDRIRMSANHQEMVQQLNLSYSASLDIKESRIRQLEKCVLNLQGKVIQMAVQLQKSVSEHESSSSNTRVSHLSTSKRVDVDDDGGTSPPPKISRYGKSNEPIDSIEAAAEREELCEFDFDDNDMDLSHSPAT